MIMETETWNLMVTEVEDLAPMHEQQKCISFRKSLDLKHIEQPMVALNLKIVDRNRYSLMVSN